MAHRYKVGDQVELTYGFLDQTGSGKYEIVRVVPADEEGDPQYRIRGADGVERMISEHQIAGGSTKKASHPEG